MGAQLADAAPPLAVGRQESRHLLCELSDDNHHLMAPKRQRGPCLQCLWPLLQAAQCESAPARPTPPWGLLLFVLPGKRPPPPPPAWRGLGSCCLTGVSPSARGLPIRGGKLAGTMSPTAGASRPREEVPLYKTAVWVGVGLSCVGRGQCWHLLGLVPCTHIPLKTPAVLVRREGWWVGIWKGGPSLHPPCPSPRCPAGWEKPCSRKGLGPEGAVATPR